MNLIFIYGPPASGKLTVAKELSKLTGYPVFHNHLTRDLVRSLYPGKVDDHYDLVDTLREEVMKHCTIHGTNLIFTMVYDGPEDDEVVARRVNTVIENGGSVLFVELTAPHDILLERVSNESRKQHKKIEDRELLASLLNTKAYSSVPYGNILKIDTSIMSPQQAAKEIASHHKLT
ncbi:MAG: AAA family ATPase [Candidatus Saccharimonadales bacterium]